MLIQILAGLLFLALLWTLIRFATGLRFEKRAREKGLERESSLGRRLVAEVPGDAGITLVLEDGRALMWGDERQPFDEIQGARVLLNGGVLQSIARKGALLPEPPVAEAYEGRERWQVRLYVRDGSVRDVPCGKLREGVSREIATRVFETVRAAIA
jgi:hypothetical protein